MTAAAGGARADSATSSGRNRRPPRRNHRLQTHGRGSHGRFPVQAFLSAPALPGRRPAPCRTYHHDVNRRQLQRDVFLPPPYVPGQSRAADLQCHRHLTPRASADGGQPAAVSPILLLARAALASVALAALAWASPIRPARSVSTPLLPSQTQQAERPFPRLPRIPFLRRGQRTTSAEEVAEADARRQVASEAVGVFEARYVDAGGVPWRRVRARVKRAPLRSDSELHATLQWALGRANDTYTRYLPAGELAGMRDGIDGEMCGVGIVFSAETRGWRRARRVVVRDVVRRSPAADAGLLPGDRITAIDMAPVTSLSVDEAAARLLGRDGGRVLVSFVRDAGRDRVELSVSLTRRRFEVPTVAHAVVPVPSVGNVAFLQVRDFAANTASQARAALRSVARARVRALVLDLRGNSGGLVDQAVAFAKLFLPPGRVVVLFVGRGGRVSTERTKARWAPWARVRAPDVPVIVLVDDRTASASELVAAALRDNCRAVLVGSRTFGKGSVQAVVPLSDGAGVAVTVAAYRTPRGMRIADGQGLRPDMFRGDLTDDAGAVVQLFNKGGRKRLRWARAKIGRCDAPPNDVAEILMGRVEWWQFWKRLGLRKDRAVGVL